MLQPKEFKFSIRFMSTLASVLVSIPFLSPFAEAQPRTQSQSLARPLATPIPISKVKTEKIEAEVTKVEKVDEKTERRTEVKTTVEATVETKPLSRVEEAEAKARAATAKVGAILNQSREHRGDSDLTVMVGYAPIDMILPSKVGGSVGWNRDASASYELEYMASKLSVPFVVEDLGSFSDKRISLVKRSYGARNSFNFHYGLSYFETDVSVGNEYLASASNVPAHLDLIGVKSLGLIWGVGNRWNFKPGFTAGVDWFSWAQPLIVLSREDQLLDYINDEETRDVMKQALNLSSYVPRFTVLKVQLGWTF